MEETENKSLVDLNIHPLVFPEEASDSGGNLPKVRQQVSTGSLAPLPWGQGSLGTGPALKAAKWGWPIVLELQLQIQINQRKTAEQGQQ